MTLKIKRKIGYWAIAFLIIYLSFSILEIFNLGSLYKDQIEMSVTSSQENVSADFVWKLLEQAKQLTNWINFFQYSALTSVLGIIMIGRWMLTIK